MNCKALAALALALATSSAWSLDSNIQESPEIKYTATDAPALNAQATNLGTALYIYQYVRNNTEFYPYHGSVSGSINTYGGMRGNDVDLASTLIAMLRSQNVPARYAVGTIKVGASQIQNWLGVQDVTLASNILTDQGIQSVTLATDKSYVAFEHVWVEALVPYDNYRGAGSNTTNCVSSPTLCHWIDLDPSYKLRSYGSQNIDLHDTITFDYNSYYDAIKNNDATRLNKNPKEILEDQMFSWLNANQAGTTLEDVANTGTVIPDNTGLLPASLPYALGGTVRWYNSVNDHDAQVSTNIEPKAWKKTLSATLTVYDYSIGKGYKATIGPFSLVDISTSRMVLTYSSTDAGIDVIIGGTVVATVSSSSLGFTPTVDTQYNIDLSMDGPPSTTSGIADQPLTASYTNLTFGGYYLILTGGASSNWSQVHNAAAALLQANQQYPIVYNTAAEPSCVPSTGINCTPYVDLNKNGQYDSGEPKLSDAPAAMEALTGGMMYVAGTQYFAKLRDHSRRIDALYHTVTPSVGYVGVVSATGSPEYIANTAFSILPGGLLIDMRGIYDAGTWRVGPTTTAYSNKARKLQGYITSSLEHEIWQELIGYDAVSTVRGFQLTRAANATLLNPQKNAQQNTLPTFFSAIGFAGSAPSGFTGVQFTEYSTKPYQWTNGTDGASFDILKADVNSQTPTYQQITDTYIYSTSNGASTYAWISCVDQSRAYWASQPPGDVYTNVQLCGDYTVTNGTPTQNVRSGTVSSLAGYQQSAYTNFVIPDLIGTTRFDFYDVAQGFSPANYLYRALPVALNAISTDTASTVRNTLSLQNNGHSPVFTIPSQQAVGSTYRFNIYEFDDIDASGNLGNMAFIIQNTSLVAGGGYVDGKKVLTPSTSIAGQTGSTPTTPTFNNSTMTNVNLISETNNHQIKTPSTSDPVSTVTGNNFHDETDFVIKGRAGLNYAFTRTYNSSTASTSTNGTLGYGWTHSYAVKLKSNDYGKYPNCSGDATLCPENGNGKTSSITLTDERGGDHNYLVNETSFAVTAPQGEFESLAIDSPQAGQNTLTYRNGTKYVFENIAADGKTLTPTVSLKNTINITSRLKQIADPWGNQLNFSYDNNGRLSTVADNLGISGRTGLTFAYDSNGKLSTIKDWAGRTWSYVVDSSGNLKSYTSAQAPSSGSTYTYAYATGTHNLQTVSKPLQRNGATVSTTFNYYQNGRTFNYYDALNDTEALDYDLFRNTTRVTDARGGIRQYEYDASGRLTKLSEPDGGILYFQITSADGLRFSKKDALGYQTQYSYRSDKSFNSASDTYGNVTREQDALSNTIDTTYGPYDQVASVKDKRGNTINTSFHASSDTTCKLTGKPDTTSIASLTVSQGSVKTNVPLTSYCWNSDGTLKSKTDYLDPNNSAHTRVTTYTYTDATHFAVDHAATVGWDDTGGSSTTTIYFTYETNNLGRVKTVTLKRRNTPTDSTQISLITTYTYDNNDRVTQAQDAIGNLVINRYDDNGQLWQVTHQYLQTGGTYDTRNIITRTFDAADRVSTETDAMSGVTTYQYDQAGNVASIKDAANHTIKFEYDAMNRRTAVVDGNGNRTTTAYNLRGDVVSVTNAMGEATSFQYDSIGRKTQATDAHGYITKFTNYDANGNLLCVVDANASASLQSTNSDGCTESRQYDELNRVTLIRDALNGTTATTYDLQNHALNQIDAEGRRYTWTYDGLGRLSTEIDFAGNITSYASDEAGNFWQRTNRLGEITQTTYDMLNRPTNALYKKDNSTETLSYDPSGTLHSAANVTTNGNVIYTFSYDNLKRMQSKADSRGKSLSFTYDKTGNVQTKTTYQGSTTSYTYDSANRLVNASNPDYLAVNYQYDAAGRLLSRVMTSGARSIYGYDNGGWLSSLTHYDGAGNQVSTQSYSRDRLAHITSLTNAAGVTNYTLDALYRLTTVSAPIAANSEYFTYDHIGNRLTATRGGASIGASGSTTRYYNYYTASQTSAPVGINGAYTPTNYNRLKETRIGSANGTLDSSLTFDNEGRLTTQTGTGAKTLTWDSKGRVASVNTGTSTESYAYDPMDHRIQRSGGTLGNLSYYLEGDHLESVYSGGTLQEKYFRGASIDELVAGYTYLSGSLTPFMFQHDQVMSVSATTKPNGGTQSTQTFWSFGESQTATGTTVSRLKFTGREDDGTGLMQFRARYYDPSTGRFVSEDSKHFAAGINFYAYCGNDPTDCNDPTGNYADVVVNGSNVQINIPIYFKGTGSNDANIANFVKDIQKAWSGTVTYNGQQYNVQTTVNSLNMFQNMITANNKQNVVEIPTGHLNTATTSCLSSGACSGSWPADMSGISGVGGHEAGHILGLSDQNAIINGVSKALPGMEGDIMGGVQGTMSGSDVQRIINNAAGSWSKTATGPWNDPANVRISPSGGDSDIPTLLPSLAPTMPSLPVPNIDPSLDDLADGGFVIYPNKPNNNYIRGVYRK